MMGPTPAETLPPIILPRELVLASAGSGKTYHLSSRFIGLLARGARPEAIWASTFTRKAAGEILDRVLLRLARGALDGKAARELAESAWLDPDRPPPDGFLDREHCGRLLAELVRSLHRAGIGTLDSSFVQMATAFSEELGLPPGWRMVEGPAEDRMRAEALEVVLDAEDSAVMAELVRFMGKGEVRRGVHGELLEKVEELLRLDREVDPGAEEPWTPVLGRLDVVGVGAGEDVGDLCRLWAEELAGMAPPSNKDGSPNLTWQRELSRLAQAVRERDWKGFFAKGLGEKMVAPGYLVPAGDVVFSRHSPDPRLAEILDAVALLARREMGEAVAREGGALGRLATWYREAFEAAQRVRGRFRFEDITHLLRESAVLDDSEAIYFRMDARVRHVLLDEFQDTSLPQWAVLDPLVSELLAGGEAERAAVLVADPKQSIYGWRGAQPGLANHVRGRFALGSDYLPLSYRSGPVILDTVADVFRDLPGNPVIEEMDEGPEVASEWVRDFYPQEPHDPRRPGFAQLVVGPRGEGRGALRPALLDFAAELVEGLHRAEPRASVGVLVRTNRVVSYLIAALRRLEVPASGEGGTPLTDTAPVNALLALLRMVDHPGDRLARYHVARTPVGKVVGYQAPEAGAEASRLAGWIRGRLLREGYGATLAAWVRALREECDDREWSRLQQLVELGYRWDPDRTLRPDDFVRFVETQSVEDPTGARVRVMTVHQAKGLQFDVVVLPHLYESVGERGRRDVTTPVRDPDTGRVLRVYPAADKATRALFPELRVAYEQNRALRLRDELSALYVAMTRARYALHMVVPADGNRGPGSAKSPARIFRAALAPGELADVQGKVLFRRGGMEWHRALGEGDFTGGGAGEPEKDRDSAQAGEVRLRLLEGGRTRNLARRSPSSLEGGGTVDLRALLRGGESGGARTRGTVIHAWCERIEWLEDGLPGDVELRSDARRLAPEVAPERIDRWISEYRRWLRSPAVAEALTRAHYLPGARVERELPFLHRIRDGLLQGYVDRVVVWGGEGMEAGAEVLDFKTDALGGEDPRAVAAKVEHYRPQIDAYREAVAGRYGLDPSAVVGKLIFLDAGLVLRV